MCQDPGFGPWKVDVFLKTMYLIPTLISLFSCFRYAQFDSFSIRGDSPLTVAETGSFLGPSAKLTMSQLPLGIIRTARNDV